MNNQNVNIQTVRYLIPAWSVMWKRWRIERCIWQKQNIMRLMIEEDKRESEKNRICYFLTF